MDFKIKTEIQQLIKNGIPEEFAQIIACAKYKKLEAVGELLEDIKQEQEVLKDLLSNFQPLVSNIEEFKQNNNDELIYNKPNAEYNNDNKNQITNI